jgi:hypothetical protein
MIKKILLRTALALVAIVVLGMLIPQNLKMPVVGADHNSYNHETFWYEGWGTSIVHKGIDVFARRGTRVNSATIGIVLLTAEYGKGGKFVIVLGPKWRLHYYAHLDEITTKPLALVGHNTQIGTVGNTGNAATIPEGAYWTVSDTNIGTIDRNAGSFTAVATGDVTIEYIVDGEAVGNKTIHVIVPDDIKFVEDRITAIYGNPKRIDVTVWYKGHPVAFTPLRDAFVFFDYEFDAYGNPQLYFTSEAGVINGLEFTGSDAKGIRTTNVYAALLIGRNIVATASNIYLYYPDEATFDFENATQGNHKLAWNREIENAKSTDNMLYRVSDPNSPVDIEYTFALDMTTIDIPAQLEPLKSMLPTYQENATAWTYLLQLAERVCVQTNVTIRAEFSKDLEVDISQLKVVNDYFNLTSASLDENNVLTIVCNWVNQSQPIDAATANPLCILTGITATVKDTAAYYNNENLIANNGSVSYDIYLAASSLYSFAQDPKNQATYGLYPYIHEHSYNLHMKGSG